MSNDITLRQIAVAISAAKTIRNSEGTLDEHQTQELVFGMEAQCEHMGIGYEPMMLEIVLRLADF